MFRAGTTSKSPSLKDFDEIDVVLSKSNALFGAESTAFFRNDKK